MSNYTHQTAPTQFVEAAGIRQPPLRRSDLTIDIPLLLFMHFTGTMDHWDPAVTGCCGAYGQLIHSPAESAECSVDPLYTDANGR